MAGEEAAVVYAIQKKILRKFRDACATDPRQAVPLESLGVKNHTIVKGLIRKKILVATDPDRYYVDEDAAELFFKKKRQLLYISVIVAIVAFVIAYLLKT